MGRRLVVFVGPPKTGSTTLQNFLYKFANRNSDKFASAFGDWSYPAVFPEESDSLRLLYDPKNDQAVENFLARQGNLSIVVGSEYLFSRQLRNGSVVEMLQNWTGLQPEIVIMARNPRTSQLVSVWKQQYQSNKRIRGDSFRDFLCLPSNTKLVRARIGGTTNPLSGAHENVYRRKLKTTVIDMRSIFDAGLDVSHVFSCAVLRVPCTLDDTWVLGLENNTIYSNTRQGDPNISTSQIAAMNKAFLQRDCAYFPDLHNHSLLNTVPVKSGLWHDDCRDILPMYRSDPMELLQELRRIYDCPLTREPFPKAVGGATEKAQIMSTLQDTIAEEKSLRLPRMYQSLLLVSTWMTMGTLAILILVFRNLRRGV